MSSTRNASQASSSRGHPHANDVLFGRGAGARDHEGNRKLLVFVDNYKGAYASATTIEIKDLIARKVLSKVRSQIPRGRFLEPVCDTHSDELWREVDDKRALAKIKQALKEPHRSKAPSTSSGQVAAGSASTYRAIATGTSAWTLLSDPRLQYQLAAQRALANNAFPMGMCLGSNLLWNPATSPLSLGLSQQCGAMQGLRPSAAPVEPHLRLPRLGLSVHNQASIVDVRPPRHCDDAQQEREVAQSLLQVKQALNGRRGGSARDETQNSAKLKSDSLEGDIKGIRGESYGKRGPPKSSAGQTLSSGNPSVDSEDVEAAQVLLGSLSETVRQAEAELERDASQTTEEERDKAMADMFGIFCEISQSKKRVKRPTQSPKAVDFLLQEMKAELDAIESYDKLALSEAQGIALPVEFTDRRLGLFLRRENMNPKRAAQRFVTYWEERRKLFGPDKFYLPMTLKGALRDDHECLKSGPMFFLPMLDESGRLISCNILKRHFGDYDARSLLRVFWFLAELNSKHPNASNGVVHYFSLQGASMWDVDLEFVQNASHIGRKALLVHVRSTHLCGVPYLLSVCAKPLALTKIDRDARLRVVVHDCPPLQCVEALRRYGIPADALPKELGGTIDIDEASKRWFAQLGKLDDAKALQSDELVWWEL